ncbi:MAG: octanoyltransferase, partial [Deltaproteobacteria bacterium]|nr:octanoyltransferase [Deltaproteobacteria bacterium]
MLELDLIEAGRVSYLEGLELQRGVLEKLKSGSCADTLIIMEHHPVITAGRKARLADIHITRSDRLFRGIELHFTE